MPADTDPPEYLLHWLRIGDKFVNTLWEEIEKEEADADAKTDTTVHASGGVSETVVSTRPRMFNSKILEELVQYPEIELSSLGYFYIAEDHITLKEHAKQLTAWVQSMRKVIVDLKKVTQKMKDENERKKEERNQNEQAYMIFRAVIDAEIQPLIRHTKELFRILEKTPWNISSLCSSLTLTPGITEGFIKDASVPYEELVAIQEQDASQDCAMDIDADTVLEDNAPQIDIDDDVESRLAKICAGLKSLETDRQSYEEKMTAFKTELKEATQPSPPILRPVEISNEDISNVVAQIVQEYIPTAKGIFRQLEEMVVDDNSAAMRVFSGLEQPLRAIQLLMKRFKIPGSSLRDDPDHPSASTSMCH